MFGSPALINRVGRYGQQHGIKLPTLRRVISAGAPVPASVLERFAAMLPATAEVFTPYGATEALPVCSIGSRQILEQTRALTEQGHGVCVGQPMKGIELHIIAIDDGPIPCWDEGLKVADGQIGEIVVKGPQVTARYFNRPKADALAKIRDPAGGFFHRMGDLGYRDEAGRIWFCGRKAHRVISPDQTRYSIPCEAIFNTHPQVYRSALVGVGARHQQRPVICIELEKGVKKSTEEQIRRELLDLACQYAVTTGIRELLFHPAFPVDIRHNAKIFREKLAVWAQKELS
ncbi:MAG: AMP-binding protein [Desulfuromonadaceae bacterium]